MQNVLLLSTGSKVALTRIAHRACEKRGIVLHGIDSHPNVPTRHFVDRFQTMDPKSWPQSVLGYCEANSIGLVIPTRHSDLPILADEIPRFSEIGTQVALSTPETISICINKFSTYEFLTRNGIPTPRTLPITSGNAHTIRSQLPLVVKPAQGYGSDGVRIIEKSSDLPSETESGIYIAQSLAKGVEYTINLYVSKAGECLCAIPHRRIAVENGESVQAITERNTRLIELAQSVVRALPGAWGPLNVQAFHDSESDEAQIIEINPRLGGGYPLADQAKGTFIEWLIQEALERKVPSPMLDWTAGLRMMRYRDAIFDFPRSS